MTRNWVPLTARRTRLEPLREFRVAAIHEMLSSPQMLGLWPLRGTPVERDRLGELLWGMSNLQYSIIRRDCDQVVGLVQAIDEDPRNRTVGLAFISTADLWREAWLFEGGALFINLLFEVKGFRKIYLEMAEPTLRSLGADIAIQATTEAVHRDHIKWGTSGSRYVDWYKFSIDQASWDWDILEAIGAVQPPPRTASGTFGYGQLRELVVEICEFDPGPLTADTSLQGVGVFGLQRMRVIWELERRYGIEFSEDLLTQLWSARELVAMTELKIGQLPPMLTERKRPST